MLIKGMFLLVSLYSQQAGYHPMGEYMKSEILYLHVHQEMQGQSN